MWWLAAVAFIVVAVWFVRVVRAIRQIVLTSALLSLNRRIVSTQAGLLEGDSYRWVKPKTRTGSEAPFGPLTPRAWLGKHLDRAREVTVLLSNVRDRLSPDAARDLTRILDAEQRLLARNRVAFSPEPGFYACPHISEHVFKDDQEYKKAIPQIWYIPQGNRALSRRWCRYCLLGFEESWAIAVSGGH